GGTPAAVAVATTRDPHEALAKRKPEVPPDLARIVDRCLAKEPADRWATARDLAAALDAAMGTADERSVDRARPRPLALRRPRLVSFAAVLVLASLGAFLLLRTRHDHAPAAAMEAGSAAPRAAAAG